MYRVPYKVMPFLRTNIYDTSPDTLAAYLYVSLRDKLDVKEIIVNKNAMIPLPGTYQAGFPVKLL